MPPSRRLDGWNRGSSAWTLVSANAPYDALRRLVGRLTELSPRFAELWESDPPPAPRDPSRHKTVEHPAVGRITLDCDTLIVAADDLRITIYTAEPGTGDAERLALAVVLGTQSLVE